MKKGGRVVAKGAHRGGAKAKEASDVQPPSLPIWTTPVDHPQGGAELHAGAKYQRRGLDPNDPGSLPHATTCPLRPKPLPNFNFDDHPF